MIGWHVRYGEPHAHARSQRERERGKGAERKGKREASTHPSPCWRDACRDICRDICRAGLRSSPGTGGAAASLASSAVASIVLSSNQLPDSVIMNWSPGSVGSSAAEVLLMLAMLLPMSSSRRATRHRPCPGPRVAER